MYLDFLVEVPDEKGKITKKSKGNSIYVNYEIGREYDKVKKYIKSDVYRYYGKCSTFFIIRKFFQNPFCL